MSLRVDLPISAVRRDKKQAPQNPHVFPRAGRQAGRQAVSFQSSFPRTVPKMPYSLPNPSEILLRARVYCERSQLASPGRRVLRQVLQSRLWVPCLHASECGQNSHVRSRVINERRGMDSATNETKIRRGAYRFDIRVNVKCNAKGCADGGLAVQVGGVQLVYRHTLS